MVEETKPGWEGGGQGKKDFPKLSEQVSKGGGF